MRWILVLAMLGCALVARADFDYGLQPRQIADGVWLLQGSSDNFAQSNGGNIVNSGFIVTDQGVLVIDSGPSKRYGEALRQAIATVTDKPVLKLLLTHHHPDHVLGNQAFADVPIRAPWRAKRSTLAWAVSAREALLRVSSCTGRPSRPPLRLMASTAISVPQCSSRPSARG